MSKACKSSPGAFRLHSFFCTLVLAAFIGLPASAQDKKPVTGRVTDHKSQPLEGVTVAESGTSNAVFTNATGNFSITVGSGEATLEFSIVGFAAKRVRVSNLSNIDVQLSMANQDLGEVVVLGYGTKAKNKLVGAVNQVGSEVFKNRAVTNVGQALQGAIPNLNINFGDGQPGRPAEFNIRGFNSINGGAPLVLIDGVPGDVNMITPEDIETLSVLKDASSAAIYGARASFGVLLITTKSGKKGKTRIRYTNNFGYSQPLRTPKVVSDPLQAAEIQQLAWNGYIGSNNVSLTQIIDYLEAYKNDPTLPQLWISNAIGYVSGKPTDWYKEMFRDNTPFSRHFVEISGGAEKVNYYLSGGLQKQDGLFRTATDNLKRYNLRGKLSIDLSSWLRVSNNTELNNEVFDSPQKFTSGGSNIYRFMSQFAHPYQTIKTDDGYYTYGGTLSFGQLENGGRVLNRRDVLRNTTGIQADVIKGLLKVNGDFTAWWDRRRNDVSNRRLTYRQSPTAVVQFVKPDNFISSYAQNQLNTINLYATLTKQWNDHSIDLVAGFNQEENRYSLFTAQRDNNLVENQSGLSLTDGVATVSDRKTEWATRGYFYRLGYDFQSKYLLELNGRYDGTSRFPSGNRFGFFPSAAIGWMASREKFMEFIQPVVSHLKLRASYGALGNQQVDEYSYITTMNIYRSAAILNGAQPLATGSPTLVATDLTWETVTTKNAGIDIGVLNERLQAGFDIYERKTTDMLVAGAALPAVLGTGAPRENSADVSVKGWELSLQWADKFNIGNKPFSYSIRAIVADNKAVITRYDNNPSGNISTYVAGEQLGTIWGFETLGFFVSDDEASKWADQTQVSELINQPLAGDIKFADLNNDGKINRGDLTTANPGDLRRIGNSSIRFPYSIDLRFQYGGFDLNVFFQGVGKRDFYPSREAAHFWGFYNRWNNPVYEHIAGNYWTPENPNAYFPRPRAYMALNENRPLGVKQTRYLQNAAYLRMKTLALGYSLPAKLTQKTGISGARVFFSGQNLITWTSLSKAFDPEAISDEVDSGTFNGDGFVYPVQRVLTAGVEINF